MKKNIEIKDIEKAVKSLQNKSPGNDGLTVKFCKTFLDILKEDLKRTVRRNLRKRKNVRFHAAGDDNPHLQKGRCQSGFLPGDSFISQLLSVVHETKFVF